MQWQILTITTSAVKESKPNKTKQKKKSDNRIKCSNRKQSKQNKTKAKQKQKQSKNKNKAKTKQTNSDGNIKCRWTTAHWPESPNLKHAVQNSPMRYTFSLEICVIVFLVLAYLCLYICVFMHLFVLVLLCMQYRIHTWGIVLT